MGELELIGRIRGGVGARKGGGVALGIGDDCAILRPPRGHEVLVTTDLSLEERHFRRDWHPPDAVGHRALARGLSDLAAMGARPLAAFLSLALPGEMMASRTGRRWVERFFAGLGRLTEEFGVPLAGGDTSEAPGGWVLADIVLVGSAPVGRSLRRSGGRAGDLLYVTGALGGSAAELVELARAGRVRRGGEHPHLYPVPRLNVGLELVRKKLATAAIDLSDGLSTDLSHVCAESQVGAEVWEPSLPVAVGATLEQALHGGEDYELLFSARKSVKVPATIAGVKVTQIGRLIRASEVWIVGADGARRVLEAKGWEHFRVHS
jgi:thiamine-monophosphate kinase